MQIVVPSSVDRQQQLTCGIVLLSNVHIDFVFILASDTQALNKLHSITDESQRREIEVTSRQYNGELMKNTLEWLKVLVAVAMRCSLADCWCKLIVDPHVEPSTGRSSGTPRHQPSAAVSGICHCMCQRQGANVVHHLTCLAFVGHTMAAHGVCRANDCRWLREAADRTSLECDWA
jgi:hypothetical protein